MSVDYSLEYDIRIKGCRADFQRIPEILKENTPFRRWIPDAWYWMDRDEYGRFKRTMDKFLGAVDQCLAQEGDDLVLTHYHWGEPSSHGIIEAILNCINGLLPQMGIAILGLCPGDKYNVCEMDEDDDDYEDESSDIYGTFYSPVGVEQKILCLNGSCGFVCDDRSIFPEVDWIPAEWRETPDIEDENGKMSAK